ncbi:hypothetical protein [Amycolatopsis sp. NPDC051102]|uniref:hypothetical protein n=1 Tax=Amycolatopsis sp. NPDC051102 TaxID=3155163 RepID=UPI003445BAB2
MDTGSTWGVTALQATGGLNGGPARSTRVFGVPADAPRKSARYHTEVSDAAISLIDEVVMKPKSPVHAAKPPPAARRGGPGTVRPRRTHLPRRPCRRHGRAGTIPSAGPPLTGPRPVR